MALLPPRKRREKTRNTGGSFILVQSINWNIDESSPLHGDSSLRTLGKITSASL